MDLEKIVVKFLADASSYNRVMDGMNARLRDFARRSESISAVISAPFAIATQAAMSFTDAIAKSGIAAVTTAMSYETLGIQLEVLSGSVGKGAKLMEDLMKTAVETPFKVKDVIAAAKEIKAFGFETDEVNNIVRALGDVSAATGTPMHRLILAFGQTKIAGRLMGQEMRQFVNANVPLIENLAAVMGKPEASIKKMVENGKVGFNDVVRALNRLTGAGGNFAGLMDMQSKTMEGRWNSLVETMEIGIMKIGKAFLDGFGLNQILQDIRKWADGSVESLTKVEQKGRDLRETLQTITNIIKGLWDGVLQGVAFVEEIIESVKQWASQNEELVATIFAVALAGTGLRIAVLAITTAVFLATAAWTMFVATLATVTGYNAIVGLVVLFKALTVAIWTNLAALVAWTAAKNAAFTAAMSKSFFSTLILDLKALGGLMVGLAASTWSVVAGFVVLSAKILLLGAFFLLVGAAVWTIIENWDKIVAVMKAVVGVIVRFFKDIFKSFQEGNASWKHFGQNVSNATSSIWDGLVNGASFASDAVVGVFDYTVDRIAYGFEKAFYRFGESFLDSFRKIGEAWAIAWTGIVAAVEKGDFKLAFKIIFKAVEYSFRALILALKAEWTRFVDNLSPVGGLLSDAQTEAAIKLIEAQSGWRSMLSGKQHQDAIDKDVAGKIQQLRNMRDEAEKLARSATEAKIKKMMDDDKSLITLKRELDDLVAKAIEIKIDPDGLSKLEELFKKLEQSEFFRKLNSMSSYDETTNKIKHIGWVLSNPEARQALSKEELNKKELFKLIYPGLDDKQLGLKMMEEMDIALNDTMKERVLLKAKFKDDPLSIEIFKSLQPLISDLLNGVMKAQGLSFVLEKKFNTMTEKYTLLPDTKSYAADMAQKHMRGVGEETDKYKLFHDRLGMIRQAESGMTSGLREQYDDSGPLMKFLISSAAKPHVALNPAEADYSKMVEFDKLKKFVGESKGSGTRVMMEGSSEAQETINRSKDQNMPVLDEIRNIIEQARLIEEQQNEYQKQAVKYLNQIANGSRMSVAPMPRASDMFTAPMPRPVGFGVVDPPG